MKLPLTKIEEEVSRLLTIDNLLTDEELVDHLSRL